MYSYHYSNTYIDTLVFLLLVNFLLGVKMRMTRGYSNNEKWIIRLINSGITCTLFDGLCILLEGKVDPVLFYAMNAGFYLSYSFSVFWLMRYTLMSYFWNNTVQKKWEYILPIPFVIVSIMAIVSYWTKTVFYIDENGIYQRGPAYFVFFAIGMSYIIINSVLVVIYFLRCKPKTFRSAQPLIYALPLLLGPVIQAFVPEIPATSMGLTLSFISIFANNQEVLIERGVQGISQIAALCEDYEAVHVADLDKGLLSTVRFMIDASHTSHQLEDMPYAIAVDQMVKRFVMPEAREEMIAFLNIDAMKKRIEQEHKFTYRYAVLPNDNGHFIYEMTFVRASENPHRHLVILGAKCIDDILKIERVEGQYNMALLHDSKFFYQFDVTEGIVYDDFNVKEGYDPFFGKTFLFPMPYDLLNQKRSELFDIDAKTEKEKNYWTCAGLLEAYEKGKRSVEIRYASEKVNMCWTATIILTMDETSNHLHAVYICKDVTEMMIQEASRKKELEQALINAKRANAAKTEFLSRMSHDIRTPLNGIIGIMDINEKHSEDRALVDENRKKARVAADHLLSLINDVLDMSKLEEDAIELVYESCNFKNLCAEVLMMCNIRANERGIKVLHDNGEPITLPYVRCSSLHVKQVLMNLLNNCIKYNKPNGSIRCSTRMLSHDENHVVYQICIQDTGIGMSEEFIEHIFEPFTQEHSDARSRYQGTGMGMAIVKRLIDKMNGEIRIESKVDVGTTFYVTFPFEIDHTPEVTLVEVKPGTYSIEGMRILLVEDNELNMEIAQCVLGDMGAVITTACNGLEAVNIYKSKRAGSFDAILMDIMMPELDGYEATRRIRQSDKADAMTIPIIAMTANAFAEDVANAKKAGMNAHIAKPMDNDLLLRTLYSFRSIR